MRSKTTPSVTPSAFSSSESATGGDDGKRPSKRKSTGVAIRRIRGRTPSVTPSACHLPRRGRSRLQVEVTLVNETITEIFDFVILVKLFMLTDCTSLEEEGHGAV